MMMSTDFTDETYPKEKVSITVDGIKADVETELGQTEGCLRNKVRIAQLEARLKRIEEVLGIK